MFGLFKKQMSNDHLLKMQQLAEEALNGIDGAYRSGKLAFTYRSGKPAFKRFEIDLTNKEERQAVLSALRTYFKQLSHNPDNWIQDLQELDAERKFATDATNAEHAAFAIFAALLKMNLMCKWALEYWDDKRVRTMTANVLATNGEALDAIARGGETEPSESFDPGPSQEMYSELIYINRFMDRWIRF